MKTVYVVAFVRTSFNETEWLLLASNGSLQRAFDDPVEAAAFAMESGWYPFALEKIPFGQPETKE